MDIKEAKPPSINLNQLNLQLKNLYTETLSIYQKCQQKQDGKCKEIYQNLLKKGNNDETNEYVQDKLRSAMSLRIIGFRYATPFLKNSG